MNNNHSNNLSFVATQPFHYVANPNPSFVPPKHHKSRPMFLIKAFNYASTRKVWYWEGFSFYKKHAGRQRRFNLHRGRAIQSGTLCMIHHVDIVTGLVHASCEQMADMCGLSTYSKRGNKSITRFTRMIDDLEKFYLVKTEKVWDRVLGQWIPKMIWLTDLFWRMVGLNEIEYHSAQNQQLGYRKRGLSLKEQENLTVTEAKRLSKKKFIEAAFNRRKKAHQRSKERRAAKTFSELPLDRQRSEIAHNLTKLLTKEELDELGLEGFRIEVNIQLGKIRNLLNNPLE